MHQTKIPPRGERVGMRRRHRGLGGHAGMGYGKVALPFSHSVAPAGIAGPASVLEDTDVPPRCKHSKFRPRDGDQMLQVDLERLADVAGRFQPATQPGGTAGERTAAR